MIVFQTTISDFLPENNSYCLSDNNSDFFISQQWLFTRQQTTIMIVYQSMDNKVIAHQTRQQWNNKWLLTRQHTTIMIVYQITDKLTDQWLFTKQQTTILIVYQTTIRDCSPDNRQHLMFVYQTADNNKWLFTRQQITILIVYHDWCLFNNLFPVNNLSLLSNYQSLIPSQFMKC